MEEDAGEKNCEREDDGGNAQGMADTVDRVLMAGGVLRDPLLAGSVAEHAEDDTTAAGSLHGAGLRVFGSRSLIRKRSGRSINCVTKDAARRAAPPDPSLRKERSLRMTITLHRYQYLVMYQRGPYRRKSAA